MSYKQMIAFTLAYALSIGFILAVASYANAAELTFGWSPNPASDNVTGYKIYHGATRDALDGGVIDVGLPALSGGIHIATIDAPDTSDCFACVAYNDTTSSNNLSDIVCLSDAPADVDSLHIVRSYESVIVIHDH
jgi:hypothetical protein